MQQEYTHEFRMIGKSGKVQIFAPEKMNHRGYMRGIYIEDILYGYMFIVEHQHRITPGRLQICDYLAEYVAEWIVLHPDHEDIWNEQQLMLDLLYGTDIDQERIEYLLALNHWDPQSPKRLLLVGGNEQFANMIKPLRIVLGRIFENALFAYTSEYIAILINLDLIERSFLKRRLAAAIEHIYAYCVCSFEFVSLQETAIHFTQCTNVMSLCEKKQGEIYDCKDFGLKYLLRELSSSANRSMLHPALGVLSDGKWRKTDLYNTLKTFLLNERNLVKTAEALNIHRSTLLYRLEKIKSITEIDLDDPCERMYLLISFLSEA